MSAISWVERHQVLLLGLAALLLGAGLLVSSALDEDPDGIEFAYGSAAAPGSPIRVQIAGGVARPGVYELRAGDRVLDAVAAAGGPTPDAEIDNLNLARRVRDEERLDIPVRKTATASLQEPGAKVDINTATEKQLDALPGIGEAYSRRIVDSRKVDGPYKSTRDLVDRKVIPASTFEMIRDLITAGQ